MSLSDYAGLKSEVVRLSGRDDLSESMDTFIDMTEDVMFNNDDQPLRLRAFETTATLTTVSGTNSLALPSSFLEVRSVKINYGGYGIEMTYNSPAALSSDTAGGFPSYYTVIGSNLVFDVTPDGAYDIDVVHSVRPTALSSSNTTNSVLAESPTIYLYGCMAAMNDLSGEAEQYEYYYGKMLRSIRGAMRNDSRGGATLASSRVRGVTP